jgi:trehalose/maltose hydrolase-like predicted phosphorylase
MSDFTLAYDRFVPEEEGLREALTSTGNGYFCTRGAPEWEDAHDAHYPGTYAHGGLQPRDDDHGGTPRPQRGSGEPAQLARAQAPDRGGGGDRL